MTESSLDSQALPISTSSLPQSSTGTVTTTAPKKTLNASAKPFVFNTHAPVWTPPASFHPAPAPAPAPAAPAVAPEQPIVTKLKPTAKAFVPSFLATPFIPASTPTVPSTPMEASPVKDVKQVDVPEPETQVIESEVEENEPETEEPPSTTCEAEEPKEITCLESESIEEATEKPMDRFYYTIEQLLSFKPFHTPMPSSIKTTLVALGMEEEHQSSSPITKNERRRGDSRRHSSSSSRRDSQRSRSSQAQEPPLLEDCVPLTINEETRWKPSNGKLKQAEAEETTETSLKEAQSILNKLSMEKFETLSNQLIEVAVRHLSVLKGVISMVILKAQMEWHFSTMYAELCAKMAATEMPAIKEEENELKEELDTRKRFRKLLLTRCQQEFESTKQLEKENTLTLKEDERLEKELILKRSTLGHIRFIGELYKQGLLSSKIMHACIQRLFGEKEEIDEENMECLIKLLTTIGQLLEQKIKTDLERIWIQQYYSFIHSFIHDTEKKEFIKYKNTFYVSRFIRIKKKSMDYKKKRNKSNDNCSNSCRSCQRRKRKSKRWTWTT